MNGDASFSLERQLENAREKVEDRTSSGRTEEGDARTNTASPTHHSAEVNSHM